MLAGGIVAVLALTGACALTEAHDVSLPDHNIRVRDIVDADCSAASDPDLGDAVVAALPRGQVSTQLTRGVLANLIRRRVPALTLRPADRTAPMTFHTLAERNASGATPCFTTTAPIAAGEVISGADLTPTSCSADQRASLAYDRIYGVTRAGFDIAAGAYLGRVSAPIERAPDTGDPLTMVVVEGATRVEMPVTAAQPASHGGALFVRDTEGHVFAAPLPISGARSHTP